MVTITYRHECGPRCDHKGCLVSCTSSPVGRTGFVVPEVRCVMTGDVLKMISIKGLEATWKS